MPSFEPRLNYNPERWSFAMDLPISFLFFRVFLFRADPDLHRDDGLRWSRFKNGCLATDRMPRTYLISKNMSAF
ncbi:hypothetical protein NC99_41710 [Sunxiuqinia dokdonensis]|uniref:Uncharacterized protein n=1 Tax=Sunxiuqinia dokdonensis TaxID=1409788 RepID=A0A0L8V373_9BACT|nr:hypothetical protein NC99_41710 [Sunxiuqinia dokdonensis]